jgi:hypothetical protein
MNEGGAWAVPGAVCATVLEILKNPKFKLQNSENG